MVTTHSIPTLTENDTARFWAKVNKDGPVPEHAPHLGQCWVWTASVGSHGYGQFSILDQPFVTHRFSWMIHNGPIQSGLCVLHRCDNRPCINPDHLFLGTKKDNTKDMYKKGRQNSQAPKGTQNGNSKLTEDEVREIRDLYATGLFTFKQLAERFSLNERSAIGHIVHRRNWKHVV